MTLSNSWSAIWWAAKQTNKQTNEQSDRSIGKPFGFVRINVRSIVLVSTRQLGSDWPKSSWLCIPFVSGPTDWLTGRDQRANIERNSPLDQRSRVDPLTRGRETRRPALRSWWLRRQTAAASCDFYPRQCCVPYSLSQLATQRQARCNLTEAV